MELISLDSPDNQEPVEQRASSETGDEDGVPGPSTITVDPRGDVVLVAGSTCLRASSHVLRLASPVFGAMLEPGRFLEGQSNRDSDNPATVKLEDDDPEALAMLCDMLHFKTVQFTSPIELLVAFTNLCDKYQCAPSVKCHIACWLSVLEYGSLAKSEQLQILWVSFAFGLPAEFEKISGILSTRLDEDEVETVQMHERLPDLIRSESCSSYKADVQVIFIKPVIDDIRKLRTAIFHDVLNAISSFVDTVRDAVPGYPTDRKLCTNCDRAKPLPTKTCGYCGNTTFQAVICEGSMRTDELINWLRRNELWPLHGQLHGCPFETRRKLSEPLRQPPFHKCEGGTQCAVQLAKVMMERKIVSVLDAAPGLRLSSYRVLS